MSSALAHVDDAQAASATSIRILGIVTSHSLPFSLNLPTHRIFSVMVSTIDAICAHHLCQERKGGERNAARYRAQIAEAALSAHISALRDSPTTFQDRHAAAPDQRDGQTTVVETARWLNP
jgi:hypothetical protein